MRHTAAIIAAVVAAGTAACSIPEKQLYPPFGCNQQALPDKAQDVITIRGSVVIPSMDFTAVPDALIQIHSGGSVIGSVTSLMDGSFVIHQSTDGKPVPLFLKVSAHSPDPENPFLDTYYYPSAPLTEDLDVQLQMISPGLATQSLQRMGVDLDLTKILLAITVVNCNHVPQGGATVSTTPAGAPVHYLRVDQGRPVPDPTQPVTDPEVGTAFAANIPVPTSPTDPITIHATMPDPRQTSTILTLRDNPITGDIPEVLIQADIQP